MPNESPTAPEERQTASQAEEKVWTPLFMLIGASALLFFMAGMGLNTGSSVYLARIGSPSWVAGVSAASFSVAAAIMRIISGKMIDVWSRYVVVAVGSILFVVVTVAPLAHLGNEAFLVIRIVQGIAFAMVTTTLATMASDVLPLSRLGEGLGFYGLSQAIAMSVGPAIALFLVETDPAENLFVAISILAACACIMCLRCRYERNPDILPKTSGYRMRVEDGRAKAAAIEAGNDVAGKAEKPRRSFSALLADVFELRALCGGIPAMLYSPVAGFCIYFVGLFATQMGLVNGGVFYTLSAVAMIFVRMGSRLFMDRVAPIRVLGFGLAFGIVSMGLLLYICSYEGDLRTILFCVAGFAYGICNGLCMPVCQSVAVKNTPPDRWGAANGLVLFTFDVGLGIASVAWGFVNDVFGYGVTFELCIVALVLTFVVAFLMFPKGGEGRQ